VRDIEALDVRRRGRLGKFSLEMLLQFTRLAGIDVEIRMKPSSKPGLTVKTKAA